jgi:hypothetical protein
MSQTRVRDKPVVRTQSELHTQTAPKRKATFDKRYEAQVQYRIATGAAAMHVVVLVDDEDANLSLTPAAAKSRIANGSAAKHFPPDAGKFSRSTRRELGRGSGAGVRAKRHHLMPISAASRHSPSATAPASSSRPATAMDGVPQRSEDYAYPLRSLMRSASLKSLEDT